MQTRIKRSSQTDDHIDHLSGRGRGRQTPETIDIHRVVCHSGASGELLDQGRRGERRDRAAERPGRDPGFQVREFTRIR